MEEEVALIHSCGVALEEGEYETYHTFEEKERWEGVKLCYEGMCPVCRRELDPEYDFVPLDGEWV